MPDESQPQPVPKPLHQPVLPQQVLELLAPGPGMVCLDCTVGVGGHAQLIAPHLAPGGRYIGLDVDPRNLEIARQRLAGIPVQLDLVRSNFAAAGDVLAELGVTSVDLLLADLGFSSNQMADPDRGFSFQADGPLDMRLDPGLHQTAADLVNELPQDELANLIFRYGEERRSRAIARKIVEVRRTSPINTTRQLAQVVRQVSRPPASKKNSRGRRIDPATRTFMALRIAVNAELAALERLIDGLGNLLRPGATAAVISFHSLEDRLVKQAFVKYRRDDLATVLTAKPIVADDEQQRENPRSRSAKLRAIRWIGQ